MGEVQTEVKTFTIDYECDDCGGDVKYLGTYNPTNPPKCHHECAECGKRYVFLTTYPKTVYRRV